MQNPAATIHCSNHTCQAPNPESSKFCHKCREPLQKKYLWALGGEDHTYRIGDLIAGRFFCKGDRILLDTKPAGSLPTVVEIPDAIAPYLKLFPYRLHIPQVYGILPQQKPGNGTIWLLEDPPINLPSPTAATLSSTPTENNVASTPLTLKPTLIDSWKTASALRQLNWLWQIAQLWQPFRAEGVVGTLLNPQQLRVEGSIVRLLELQRHQNTPSLPQLGQLWSHVLLADAQPLINPFLEALCQRLSDGEVRSAEQLVEHLDRAMTCVGRSQTRRIQIATQTDQGPSRRRNEDACYPPTGTQINAKPGVESLVIVCDGIGGHEGGNVASSLAIEAVEKHTQQLPLQAEGLNPSQLTFELESAACIANDLISKQNDREQRQGRQRMGTTIVMALARFHELYITHVGDSRAYWITSSACRQVTLDDDVASREVRLGYALYREALQQVAAGSLVQALGMGSSNILHPTVTRFIVDEDSVFLLCSDGLSDHDRVEQYWDTEILPLLLENQTSVEKVVAQLLEIGNTQNGHDNVTIGLLHCQVSENRDSKVTPAAVLAQLDAKPTTGEKTKVLVPEASDRTETTSTDTIIPTVLQPQPQRWRWPWQLMLFVLVLLPLTAGVWAYLFMPELRNQVSQLMGFGETPSTPTPTDPPPTAVLPSPTPMNLWNPGDRLRLTPVKSENVVTPTDIVLMQNPGEIQTPIGSIPSGSILQILEINEPGDWFKLKVCSVGEARSTLNGETQTDPALDFNGSNETSAPSSGRPQTPESTVNPANNEESGDLPQLEPGAEGWIAQAEIQPMAQQVESLTEQQRGQCPPLTASPSPTATPREVPSPLPSAP